MNFDGLKVVVTADFPKMKLAPGDYITPEFRQEIDLWLLGFFGTSNMLDDGQVIGMGGANTVCVNPRTYAMLKAAK